MPWPESGGRPGRVAGAYVVLVDGDLAAYLERGARSLATFGLADAEPAIADAIASLVKDGRLTRIELTRVDGEPPRPSPLVDALHAAGFVDGYRGLVLRG